MQGVRKPKTPTAAWIVENRRRLGWKSEELAQRLDVSDSTVRGWESGRSVSADNLDRLEREFGRTAPGRDEPDGDLATAIRELTAYLRQRDEESAKMRQELDDLRETVAALSRRSLEGTEAPPGRGARATTTGSAA
jgi:transcriptional regulator with XRE-family HTH domain